MSDMMYLYAAYTVIWVGLFLYVFKLHTLQKKLRRDMKILREVMDGRREGRKKDI